MKTTTSNGGLQALFRSCAAANLNKLVRGTGIGALGVALLAFGSAANGQTLQTYFNFTTYGTQSGGASLTDLTGNTVGTLTTDSHNSLTTGGLTISSGGSSPNTGVQIASSYMSGFTGPFTIQAWVTLSAVTVNQVLFGANNYGAVGGNHVASGPTGSQQGSTLMSSIRGNPLAISDYVGGSTPSYNQYGYGVADSSFTAATATLYDVVLTYDGTTFREYINGTLEGSGLNMPTFGSLATASSLDSSTGKGGFSIGGGMNNPFNDTSLPETTSDFLLYNGALSQAQITAIHNLGAGASMSSIQTALSSYFTPTLSASPKYAAIGQQIPLTVAIPTNANASSTVTVVLTNDNSSVITMPGGNPTTLTFTAGATNVQIINLSVIASGAANISVVTNGSVGFATIQLIGPQSPVLAHEYSFSDANGSTTVADSVGGASWDGTLPNGGDVNPGYAPNQLVLLASSSQYVQLPAGVISNYTAVTIDCWVTFASLPSACFLYGFGNTDGGGAGEKYVFCQPNDGRIAITGSDPGYTGEQGTLSSQGGTGAIGSFSNQTVHVTSVYNPVEGWIAIYTNGVLAAKNISVTIPMSSVTSVLNYIGRSLYNGDSYMDLELNEFRIYNGALTGQGIAISDAAGPDSNPDTITNGPGTLLSFSIQAPATMLPFKTGKMSVLANYTDLSNWYVIANSVLPPAGMTVSSSDTNVLTYGGNGVLNSVNTGTATITVVYQNITNTASVIVQSVAPYVVTDTTASPNVTLNYVGQSETFAATLGGSLPVALQWQVSPNPDGSGAVNIAGATNATLALNNLQTTNTGYYSLRGTNTVSPFTTNSAWTQLTVINPVLVHRYSFNDANGSTSAADSVGGPAWNGTVMSGTNGVPTGGAFTNGVLSLRAASTNYLQLPGGILSNYTAVTIDIWADMVTLPNNCMLWAFGGTDPLVLSSGQASGYNCIFCAPKAGNITISDKDPSWQGGQGVSDVNWSGQMNLHVTAVFDQPAGYMSLYTNGVLAATTTQTIPMNSVSNLLSYVGRSLYNADPYPDLNVSEFRIYNGPLSAGVIAANQALGPDVITGPSTNAATANFKATVSGGAGSQTMNFSWAPDHQGWQLYTNSVGLTATGSWFPVPGSAAVTNESVGINPAQPQVFFQLRYP